MQTSELDNVLKEFSESERYLARSLRGETIDADKSHLIFEQLPDRGKIGSHFEEIKNDLRFFSEVCGIEITQREIDICLFWRLKTGKSLAEMAEDIICQNLSFANNGWLTPSSRLPTEEHKQGQAIVITGLPGFGKSRFLNELKKGGDLLPIDTDTFRFFTLARDILEVDADLFDDTPEGEWQKTQHLYCPMINKTYRLLAVAVATTLKVHGQDIVGSGIPLTAIADNILWVESEELPMEKFLSMQFPSYEEIENLAKNSKTEEEFLSSIQNEDFKNVIEIVRRKVDERAENAGHVIGSLPWKHPKYQPLLHYHTPGANPKMNVLDIAFTILGNQEDIKTLISLGAEVFPILDSTIPDRKSFIEERQTNPIDVLIHPERLQQARVKAIAAGESVIKKIPEKLSAQIFKILSPDGPQSKLELMPVARKKMEEVIRGLFTGTHPDSVQGKIFKADPSTRKELISLLAQVLVTDLTLVNESSPSDAEFVWPTRWEPATKSYISSPVHSLFELPALGILLQGERYDDYHRVVDAAHDNGEEGTKHNEVNGIIKKGVRYSSDSMLRHQLFARLMESSERYGPLAALSADLATEAAPESYYRKVGETCQHVFTKQLRDRYFEALNGASMGEDLDRRSYQYGPTRFTLLAIQESLASKVVTDIVKDGIASDRETAALISNFFRDRMVDTDTLFRYLDVPFLGLTPEQARIKTIAYASRLFTTHSYLTEAYNVLPKHLQQELATTSKVFTPLFYWGLREHINPRLEALDVPGIQDKEITSYYHHFHVPLVEELHPLLEPFAKNRVKIAIERSYGIQYNP